jgi:hypothetical protein
MYSLNNERENMHNYMAKKTLFIGIIILLIGTSNIPIIQGDAETTTKGLIEIDDQILTIGDTTPPAITINFAGNLGDLGGPYWRPPLEYTPLTSIWKEGYYTNNSRQIEDWIYINLTVTDDRGVDEVWLHWKNGTTWVNHSYQFVNAGADSWEFNSSGNIPTAAGYNYSFDIWATDTSGNTAFLRWSKIGIHSSLTRRHIQMNCAPTEITYAPYYCYAAAYTEQDKMTRDRLQHDQGPDGSLDDTGILLAHIPTDEIQERHCGLFIGYWFDESVCIEPFRLINIYQHYWWGTLQDPNPPLQGDEDLNATVGWSKSREQLPLNTTDRYVTKPDDANSIIKHRGDWYYLKTQLITLSTPVNLTDNNLYELLPLHVKGDVPTSINNRSIISYVLLNVPDNDTLNTSYVDSDNDGLSDWTELYRTYTSPFLFDTDNDRVSDYEERISGSDPNNYTDTQTPSFICGDCNADGIIDIGDITYLINYLFKDGQPPTPLCVGDVNADNGVDSGDIVYLINYLYCESLPPHPECC